MKLKSKYIGIALIFIVSLLPIRVLAHCDTMDGPVVRDAKAAIEKADVTLVLKWIKQEYENEVRQAFQKTLEVRKTGKTAKELADMYFFETVVRLHRAGEGEPYTGLKPVGTPVEPIIQNVDKALESGGVRELAKQFASTAEVELNKKFHRVLETKKEADKSVEAGREYVEAYVEYVHYAEQLFNAINKTHGHVKDVESEEMH